MLASVAQWIEHLTSDQRVGGSSPSGRALWFRGALRCRPMWSRFIRRPTGSPGAQSARPPNRGPGSEPGSGIRTGVRDPNRGTTAPRSRPPAPHRPDRSPDRRTGVRDPNRGPGSEPGHQRTTLTPTRPTSAGRGTGWGHVGLGDQPPAETGISQVKIAEPRTKVRSSELVSPESSLSKSSSLSLLVFSTKHDRISSVMVTPAPNA